MKVVPRRYALCTNCSRPFDDLDPAEDYTVQWLVNAPEPKRRAWGVRKPAEYRCRECGEVMLG